MKPNASFFFVLFQPKSITQWNMPSTSQLPAQNLLRRMFERANFSGYDAATFSRGE